MIIRTVRSIFQNFCILKLCIVSFGLHLLLSPDASFDTAFATPTWLPVCVSVTLMYCAKTTESIIMRPSPDCRTAILVFPYQIWPDSSRGFPSLKVSNGRGLGRSRKIRPINRSHSPEGISWQRAQTSGGLSATAELLVGFSVRGTVVGLR